MPEDLRKALHQEIDTLQTDLMQLAALTGEMAARATVVLLGGDLGGAQALIDADDEVDALSLDIDDRCFSILALQSPLAGDLRFVIATLKINADLERSADLMVNIAKATRRLYGMTIPARLRGLFQRMSDEGCRLLRLAMDAFADRNGALGNAIGEIDDRLDEMQREFVQELFAAHGTPPGGVDVQTAVQLAMICRFYERLGDHAVNIGQWVGFLADGHRPEHRGAERAKARQAERSAAAAASPHREAAAEGA